MQDRDFTNEINADFPITALTDRGVVFDNETTFNGIVAHDGGAVSFIALTPDGTGSYSVKVDFKASYINTTKRAILPNFNLVATIVDFEIQLSELSNTKWSAEIKLPYSARAEVYFIQASNGLIKIGISGNATHRLANLRTMSPLPLTLLAIMPGDFSDEVAMHLRFAKHRLHGEWFTPADELLDFINSIKKD